MLKSHHNFLEIAMHQLSSQELKATHVEDQDVLPVQLMQRIDVTILPIVKQFLPIQHWLSQE
jgi:hypothetical protein